MSTTGKYVILGTGQLGLAIMDELVELWTLLKSSGSNHLLYPQFTISWTLS